MTSPQTTQRSPLKDARLLHKLGKRLGISGAGLPRIIATLQRLKADADAKAAAAHDPSSPACIVSPLPLRADMSLDELLSIVDGLQPVAGSVKTWHQPQRVKLTSAMQALQGAATPPLKTAADSA